MRGNGEKSEEDMSDGSSRGSLCWRI